MKSLQIIAMTFIILILFFCSTEIRQEQNEDYDSKCAWPADCRKIREADRK